jgi:hypothetical protein
VVVSQELGIAESKELVFNRYRISTRNDGKLLQDGDGGCTTMWLLLNDTGLYAQKCT